MDKKHETKEEADEYRDSLGQKNPAQDLQKKTIEESAKMNKEREENAKKSEKSEGHKAPSSQA
jgi:hypothetical protein